MDLKQRHLLVGATAALASFWAAARDGAEESDIKAFCAEQWEAANVAASTQLQHFNDELAAERAAQESAAALASAEAATHETITSADVAVVDAAQLAGEAPAAG